jgi:hypothetical protein
VACSQVIHLPQEVLKDIIFHSYAKCGTVLVEFNGANAIPGGGKGIEGKSPKKFSFVRGGQ